MEQAATCAAKARPINLTGGPVQGLIRGTLGFETAKDYYFPEIRSIGGAIFVMGFVLYPYVYILARTGFSNSPRSLFETASLYGENKFFNHYSKFQLYLMDSAESLSDKKKIEVQIKKITKKVLLKLKET